MSTIFTAAAWPQPTWTLPISSASKCSGPQGTLYGRNTIAGAVKIITRTPGEDFWADGSLAYGPFDTTKLTASVGGEVAPGLGASIAGLYHERGEGWIERGSVGGRELGEYDNKALRGKLNWFGGDVFGATLSLAYVDAENDGYNGIPYGPSYNPASAPGAPLEGFDDTLVPDSSIGKGATGSLTVLWSWPGRSTRLRSSRSRATAISMTNSILI